MPAGSKPGERRGGRKAGTPNANTPDVKALARKYTHASIETLAKIMLRSKNEVNRSIAAEKLLDRGWGKPTQALGVDPDQPTGKFTISWEK